MSVLNTVTKFVTGIIKLRGHTDDTIIGNVSDSLKTISKITDGTSVVKVESAGTFFTGIERTNSGATINARTHQQYSSSHDLTPFGDDKFYPQNMNIHGDVITDVAALKGTRIDVNSGLKSDGTQRVILATDQPTVPVYVNGSNIVNTELPTPIVLADGTINSSMPYVAAYNMGYNGTTWDRELLAALHDLNGSSTVEYAVAVSPRMLNPLGTSLPALMPNGTIIAGGEPGIIAFVVENEAHGLLTAPSTSGFSPSAVDSEGSPMMVGNRFHDEADVGQPVKVGGKASASIPAAVSANDRVNAWNDLNGRRATFLSYLGSHIATNTTTTIKSGAGHLHSLTINTRGTVSTATIYDNTAASGTTIAVIDTTLSTIAFLYDVYFSTGLTVVTAGSSASDITVSYM